MCTLQIVGFFACAGQHGRQISELKLLLHMQPDKGREGEPPHCTLLMHRKSKYSRKHVYLHLHCPAVDVDGLLSCKHT